MRQRKRVCWNLEDSLFLLDTYNTEPLGSSLALFTRCSLNKYLNTYDVEIMVDIIAHQPFTTNEFVTTLMIDG